MSLSARVSKLEAATAPAELRGPMILIHYAGETRAEVLRRYGLPEDFEAKPSDGRVSIGGIDLRNDI